MRKLVVSLAASSLVWSATAFADDPPNPQGPQAPVTVTQDSAATSTTTTTTTTAAPVVSTTSTTSAETSDMRQPMPPADVPAPETRAWVNKPLLVTGSALLVATWVPMAAVAYASSRPEDQNYLYVPVVGPWLDLAHRDTDVRPSNNEGLNKAFLIADGIGQGLGALAVVTSLFLPDTKEAHWYTIGSDKMRVAPTHVGTGYGLGAVGRF